MAKRTIFEKRNVLITGGAGFIGSHLCDRLIKKNRIICLDNFLTSKEENINHHLANPDFEFIKHDLTEPVNLEELPELKDFKIQFQGVQEVYHLACPTSPADYKKYPIETLLANAYATRNALEIAKKYQAKFILASSSTIYGEILDPENIYINEEYWGYVNPIGEKSSYDEGKRFAESLVYHYHKKFGLDAKIARIWNTYGPRMRLFDGRLVPDLISEAVSHQPLHIYGDADKISSYCYVSDLIEGIVRLANSSLNEPVNLGNPQGLKISELAEKIIKIAGARSRIEKKPLNPELDFKIKQSLPEITRAKEKLGWFPMVNIDNGLAKTIEYMKGLKAVGIESIINK